MSGRHKSQHFINIEPLSSNQKLRNNCDTWLYGFISRFHLSNCLSSSDITSKRFSFLQVKKNLNISLLPVRGGCEGLFIEKNRSCEFVAIVRGEKNICGATSWIENYLERKIIKIEYLDKDLQRCKPVLFLRKSWHEISSSFFQKKIKVMRAT